MSLRETINNNSAVATIVAVVVLVIALGILVWTSGSGGGGGDYQVYFYDLNTKTISKQPANTPSPHDIGGGTFSYFDGELGSGVRATIFACEEDLDLDSGMTLEEVEAAGAKIISLQRFTPQALETQQRIFAGEEVTFEDADPAALDSGTLVSDLEGKTWYVETSQQATELMMNGITNLCAGGRSFFVAP